MNIITQFEVVPIQRHSASATGDPRTVTTSSGGARSLMLLLWLAFLWLGAGMASAHPLDVWRARSSGVGNALGAVAYGNGAWVVVGNEGTLLTSPDGVSWTLRNVGVTTALNSVVFANGLFVVVGEAGKILTSPNGTNWTTRPSGTSDFLYDVTFGGGRFVAVSDTGTVMVSLNGTSWTRRTTTAINVFGVAYGNGRYVGVGGYWSGWPWPVFVPVTYTSPDLVTWTETTSGAPGGLSDVIFGNGKFVAVGAAGALVTSADGTTWTRPSVASAAFLWNVTFAENTFVVVDGEQGNIFSSTDGVNWAPRSSGTANGLFNVGYGNGTFVAVGQYGTILQSASLIPPRLQMSASGGNVRFSWPAEAGNFWLEETEDLLNPAWAYTTGQSSVVTNSQVTIDLPRPAGSRFYRLAGQQ